jgi:fimbrial isopeptide formation D2 family protein/uncharacterized repeat protein (TIGR01451 family)
VSKKSSSPFLRFFACLILIFVTVASLVPLFGVRAKTQGPVGPTIWLKDSQPLAVTYSGSGVAGAMSLVGVDIAAPQPVAMVQGDFDQDGVSDLAVGYSAGGSSFIAIHRGNMDAFAPRTAAAFQAIAHNQFPSPFLPAAETFAVPESPDFIVTGDFTGHGTTDLAMASRSGSTIYIFQGDGKGNFTPGQTIPFPGNITSLGGGQLGRIRTFSSLIVGVSSRQQTFLAVYGGGQQGMGPVAAFPLTAPATSISFGDFGDIGPDAAFLSGGQVVLLHSSSMQLETLSLPIYANAMALGSFVYDRNPGLQIALLDSNGSIAIAAHNEFDPHARTQDEMRTIRQLVRSGQNSALIPRRVVATHGWQIVENIPSAAPYSSSQPPVLFRTRVSNNGSDDVMVLNASMGQMAVVSHPDPLPGARAMLPAVISTMPYAGSPVAAIPARVNVDGRSGILALHQGEMAPRVAMPLPDPTFTVNRTDDPTPISPIANACNGVANDCSVREAILKANSIAGTDTIMVPAGTYTLTIAKVANDCTGNFGALSVNDSATIVGAGQATTIIQAGATQAAGVDMVMNVNEDLGTANCPITNASASISNLTLQNGHNNGTHGNDGDGGCMEFDTGSSGNTTLSLTSVTLNNCTTTQGNGAGIAIFNFTNPGAGAVTISNSIIQANSANDTLNTTTVATAGGIWVSEAGRLTVTNSQVINNLATQLSGDGNNPGTGGGITTTSNVSGSPTVTIHASTISGNQAAGHGGGMDVGTNLLVDQSSVISGNSAGSANVTNEKDGGGIFADLVTPDSVTLTKVTISGNHAPNGAGGGIFNGSNSGGGGMTIHFSRLAGNTAGTAGTANLSNDDTTITATDNWWGTNAPATTIANTNGGTTTFDPFIVLTHTASPNKIRINQSSTLTGSLAQDNHGTAIAPSNLDVLVGLPITFHNAVLGTIPDPQPEALGANIQATATYNAGGVGGNGSADATVDQQTVTAPIIVLQPPSITKSFSPTTVATNTPSTITFSITNGNTVTIDSSFADALPAGLVVATTPNVVNGCGGSVTATAGTGTISFANAALPVGTCTIKVDVQSATDNIYSNSVTIDSSDAGNGNTSTASLTVINPPAIAKAFGAATIPLNGTTSLTFTLTSSNVNLTLNGVAFTDNLPAGLVVATPSGLSNTCGGTATATAGSGSVSLTGASLAPGASCTVSVNVTGTSAGVKNNSVTVSSTNGGTGNTSNASITVVSPPVIIKAFGAASIPLNGSTSLSFTIQNNNTTTALTGVGFSDTLPAGLVVSTPNGLTGTCGGGTITATAGSNSISLSGATLAASTSCTFSVNVTGTAAGQQNNTTSNVTSTEGGTGGTASASITVVAPPSIAKAFNPTTIAVNGTTTLTFTITNPAANTVAENGVAFTDTLPTGLVVATPNGLTNSCGGTATAVSGSTSISLAGGTIAVNTSCTVVVNVTGTASGQYTNTSGAVSSTNGGTGNTASANLTVASPPSVTKAFGAASIPLNGTTSLTFNISNPNSGLALTGVAFTDNLPAGLVIATPNNLNSTCGGTATAVAASGQVSLSAGTLAASASCTVSVNVTGTTAGVKSNSVQVTSTEGGTGNTSTASITVVGPPVIIKAFGAASIPLNGSTSLTFTIQNNNATSALSGVGFSDTLPAGLIISTPNGLTGSCGGGTITATAGTNTISLSGATLAASTSCTFSVNVTGTAAGTQNNTTGNVTSTEGGTGGTASASITVVAPPSIAKVFNPSSIALNATTSLTFTITNPAANTVALAGVAFTDTLPTGLTVANATATVCGGTLTTTSPTGIALTGATIAVNSQCVFSVTVTGAASGQFTNTTGSVTSTNGGTGNTATANLTVASAPTITKAFGAASIPLNGTTSLTFNITNPNSGLALTGVAFTDTLPAGLVIATPPNLSNTCGGTATAVSGSGQVSLSGGTLAASASCTVSVNVTGTTAGVKNNSVQVTSTEGGTGNTSNASITVVGPPVIIKAFGAASIPLNGSTSLSFTIQNNNPTATLSGIGFSDTLPAGLVISTPNGLTGSCGGGTITATAGTGVISLSGATLAASSSCTFSVNVTGTSAGLKNNTTGNVTSTEGGTGGTASASINVVAPPSIAKMFNPDTIALNATTSLTFTITNPAANAVALTGVAFTDTLPTGLTVANATATVCGGTVTTTSPTSIALSGATIAPNSQCQFSVTVTGAASGQYTNTTGNVTSTNGGTGNTATANLTVGSPPVIAKSFGAASILLNGTTSLSFTIQNPNASLTLTGIAFTDSLPAGLVVASPPSLTNTCGGTATAVGGSSSVSLSGGTLAAGASCTVSVNVTGTTAGVKNNSVTVSSANAGTGNTATASLVVVGPPVLMKAFGAPSIPLHGTTSLTFTVQNNNPTTTLTGISFFDVLPLGLLISIPNGLTGSCDGGTIIAVPGTNFISLTNATLNPSSSCTFSINVKGVFPGTKHNTTSHVTSNNGGTGAPASASIDVVAPPSISKDFDPDKIVQGATSVLRFTIVNPDDNDVALTGVAVIDNLPANITVATPNGLTGSCDGGTITATAGSGSITLTGGMIPAHSSCTFKVKVTGSVPGKYTNTTGVVTSTNGGPGNKASDQLMIKKQDDDD